MQTPEESSATTTTTTITIYSPEEEISTDKTYKSISDLLQDEQMFRLDQDPSVFDLNNNSEDFNNDFNANMQNIGDILSDDYISKPENFEMFQFDDFDYYHKKEDEENIALNPSPIAPSLSIIPTHTPVTPEKVVVIKQQPAVSVKMPLQRQESLKLEDNKDFDLIEFITNNEVNNKTKQCIIQGNKLLYFSKQNEDFQTPVEEKACPIFNLTGEEVDPQKILGVKIKEEQTEPEPSTSSAGPSRKSSIADSDYSSRPKRNARKRRYSSDSDFSIGTSASSYNDTRQNKNIRKRGRPAKELLSALPTVEDFADLPKERAEFLVLRIKNNEASRKSRMKSKNQQERLEEDCERLEQRKQFLKAKRQKLDNDIQQLRTWLLACA